MTENQSVGLGCLSPIIGITLLIAFLMNGNLLIGIIIISLSLLISIFSFSSLAVSDHILKEHEKYLLTFLPLNENFKETQSFISSDSLTRIAYDEDGKRFAILAPTKDHVKLTSQTYNRMPYDVFLYHYSDIVAVEISENGHPIASATNRSPAAQFLLKVDLKKEYEENFGRSSTSTQSPERIETMVLKILVNDPIKPFHMIRFFGNRTTGPVHKYDSELKYRQHLNEMRQWFVIINNAIKDTDQRAERNETIPVPVEFKEEIQPRSEEEHSTEYEYVFYPDELEKSPKIEEDPFADFEEFLQRNKRKQYGRTHDDKKS